MRKLVLVVILLLSAYAISHGQKAKISLDSIRTTENLMKIFADSLSRGISEQNRNAGLAMFNPALMDLLSHPETFNYPFDSIKTLSKLKSPNGVIRIYTWSFRSKTEGTFTYYGLIQKVDPKTKEFKLIGLVEKKYATSDVVGSELFPEEWYGALYYDIFEKKINRKTYYFLLGWHGNDRLTTRKVIDVLCVNQFNTFLFGAPLFIDEQKKLKNRIIFEYTAEAVMMLRYDRKKKMIVFDHLSASSPAAKDQYRFYGPDFTYDGFAYKKGYWNYKSNLELKNPGERK